MNYYQETAFQPKELIKTMQEKKLQELVTYLNQHSTFYKALFAKTNILPENISTLDDLRKIPTTTKEHLQELSI